MFFSDVLDIHKSYHAKGSHVDILGDGFLLQTNPIYRNVRSFSLEIGCRYVEAYPDYLLLPFHELPAILKRKEIPYVPAARLMTSVESGHPGVFRTEDVPMPPSHHLHEAAHVIAEHFLKNVKSDTQQKKILKMILAESFANTVDALVWTSVKDDIHYFFIEHNSYMHPVKKSVAAMSDLLKNMGLRFTFMLIFFTYVRANFLTKPLAKRDIQYFFQRYSTVKKMTAKMQKNVVAVMKIGEMLDPLFRYTTTGNYFKQQGFDGEVQDLLDFSFMTLVNSDPAFGEAIESLAGVLE